MRVSILAIAYTQCLTLLVGLVPTSLAASSPKLENKLASICTKYEGKPIFDSDGRTSFATCKWIREMSATQTGSPFSAYQKVLASTEYVSDVKASPGFPKDLTCDSPSKTADGQELQCWVNLGIRVPVQFVADRSGVLEGVKMSLRYREVRRLAAESAVSRGRISKYYDAFVDATTEVHVATWDAAKLPSDTLQFDGDNLSIYVASQRVRR